MLGSATTRAAAAACAAWLCVLSSPAEEVHLVRKHLERLDAIRTLQCDVRKDVQGPDGRLRMLSRVYFARPDMLHVENHAPVRRRIVSDGRVFRSRVEGQARGFSRAVDDLSREMQIELRKVPGTAADHLLRLRDLEETVLPPNAEFPVRRGYAEAQVFTVLSFDQQDRIARVDFFDPSDRTTMLGEVVYSAFDEALPGVWIARRHDIRTRAGAVERTESTRFSNVVINESIADGLFDASAFFDGVEFVNHFKLTHETSGR